MKSPFRTIVLWCWVFLLYGSLFGCDTHKPGATSLGGAGVMTHTSSVSSSEIASNVASQLSSQIESLKPTEPKMTLAEKGKDIAHYIAIVEELFPGITAEEKQKYALTLMEQYELPLPAIKAIGAEAKKATITTPKATTNSTKKTDNLDQYPVFPNEDEGADPSISAEEGGRGFGNIAESLGFVTNTHFELLGDARAIKGGSISFPIPDYPSTLRIEGKESNTWFNYLARDVMYESLLGIHHITDEWIPSLASHWKLSEDQQTFWYRIDPNARWSDGTPITSEDVVATWQLVMEPDLEQPSNLEVFGKYKEPQAISKYLVKVECVKANWRNFLYFSGMPIMQAKAIRAQSAKEWIKAYNFKYMPQSGPYTANIDELSKKQGNEIILRRRTDYWAENYRRSIGCNNFDQLRFIVVRDDRAAFEMVKAGELDCYLMGTSKWWIEETKGPRFERGLLLKRRFFNSAPCGTMGFAFNMKKAPYDDLRVRKALTLLIDRDELLEKLMYNQYEKDNSYWPGGDYENKNNPKNDYNPNEALRLLAEAGWNERNEQGRLTKEGIPLDVELIYTSEGLERHLTLVQNTYLKAGVNLILRRLSPETAWQKKLNREFDVILASWGAIDPPNPETSWKGDLADQLNNNNISAYKNSEVDKLIQEYDRLELTKAERVQIIQKIDGILAQEYPYALLWYGPFKRLIFWNKYGFPRGGMTRLYKDEDSIFWLWWYDPAKDQKLQEAQKNESIRLDPGETDDRYWIDVWPKLQSEKKK